MWFLSRHLPPPSLHPFKLRSRPRRYKMLKLKSRPSTDAVVDASVSFFSSSSCPQRPLLIACLTPSARFVWSSLRAISPRPSPHFVSPRADRPSPLSSPLSFTCRHRHRRRAMSASLSRRSPSAGCWQSLPPLHPPHCLWFPISLLTVVRSSPLSLPQLSVPVTVPEKVDVETQTTHLSDHDAVVRSATGTG